MTASPSEDVSGLPALWTGVRRRHLTLLILAGLGQATVAGLGAHFLLYVLRSPGSTSRVWLFAVLVAAAMAVGLLRMAERVISERLSQNYVHEIRIGLIRRNLSSGAVKSLGVAVARTTNDLSSVKSWISQGVVPLAVGIPLMLGAGVVLFLLDPLLTLGLVAPMMLLLGALYFLAPVTYHRARRLRKARGQLAGQVADTILSTKAIRSAGGSVRELQRIDRYSGKLVDAAIDRAKAAGALRGLAAATSGVTTASIVGLSLLAGLPTSHIAAALTLAGFLATPINDVGRVAEFRQTYRAARRIIGPAIEPPAAADDTATSPQRTPVQPTGPDTAGAGVIASGLSSADGIRLPPLVAGPGDRIVLETGSKQSATEILDQFVGLRPTGLGQILIEGTDLSVASHGKMRRLVGYGSQGMMLARTTITRAVSYRASEAVASESARLLHLVGLQERVHELPQGEDTVLYHGGEPLTIPERARLTLARALLNDPPLLVFDHLDADLGRDGRATMKQLLRGYPGVVIVTSDAPEEIIEPTLIWRPHGPELSTGHHPPTADSAAVS